MRGIRNRSRSDLFLLVSTISIILVFTGLALSGSYSITTDKEAYFLNEIAQIHITSEADKDLDLVINYPDGTSTVITAGIDEMGEFDYSVTLSQLGNYSATAKFDGLEMSVMFFVFSPSESDQGTLIPQPGPSEDFVNETETETTTTTTTTTTTESTSILETTTIPVPEIEVVNETETEFETTTTTTITTETTSIIETTITPIFSDYFSISTDKQEYYMNETPEIFVTGESGTEFDLTIIYPDGTSTIIAGALDDVGEFVYGVSLKQSGDYSATVEFDELEMSVMFFVFSPSESDQGTLIPQPGPSEDFVNETESETTTTTTTTTTTESTSILETTSIIETTITPIFPDYFSISTDNETYFLNDTVQIFITGRPNEKIDLTINHPDRTSTVLDGSIDETGKFNHNLIVRQLGNYSSTVEFNELEMSVMFFVFSPSESDQGTLIPQPGPSEVDLIQGVAEIGKPVKWVKVVESGGNNTLIEIPKQATKINVMKIVDDQKEGVDPEKVKEVGKDAAIQTKDTKVPKKKILIEENATEFEIEYETPGPGIEEIKVNDYKKRVTIYSDFDYENVLTYTGIPEITSDENSIKLYWIVDGRRELFGDVEYIDDDNDGLIDKLQWIVPHLSNQTFEIEIIVLNPYTYLKDGDRWVVAFNTTGQANLTISSPNAGWTEFLTDNSSTFDEMRFLDLNCGDKSLKNELKLIDFEGNYQNYNGLIGSNSVDIEKLFIEDYSCNETGYLSNHMIKAGYATLLFEFSNQDMTVTDYAYDPPEGVKHILTYCNRSAYPEYRTWNGTHWSAEGTIGNFGARQAFQYTAASPTRNEIILCAVDINDDVSCSVWNGDGESWGNLTNPSDASGAYPDYNNVDICYESLSGDAIAYYVDLTDADSDDVLYQVWNGTGWETADQMLQNALGDAVHVIECFSDPNSNYIAVFAKGTGSPAPDLHLIIWNGTHNVFNSEIDINAAANNFQQSFAGAWERDGGDFIAAWYSDTDSAINSSFWNKTSETLTVLDYAIPVANTSTGEQAWVEVKANPGISGDEIMLLYADDDADIEFNIWDGSDWRTPDQVIDNSVSVASGRRSIGFEYETSGDQALVTFTGGGDPWYMVWNGTAWGSKQALPATGADEVCHHYLDSDINSDNIMNAAGGCGDEPGDIFTIEWNGSAWDASWVTQESNSDTHWWMESFAYYGVPDPTNPTINQVQCEINTSENWQACSDAMWTSEILQIRVNCTKNGDNFITNVTYNLTNIPDSNTTILSTNASSISGDWWIYDNTDLIIWDSGEWNLNVSCVNNESDVSRDNVTWTVPWGTLNGSWVTPTSDTNVTKYRNNTFTSLVECLGGECGFVEATIDPAVLDNWWNRSWGYRRRLVFNKSKQDDALNNFPVMVKLNSSNFDYSLARSDGFDIRFIDSDNSTELSYERDVWNSTDNSFFWIKVPSIPASSVTDYIWLYYGYSSAVDGEDTENVWDESFVLVQHLGEKSGTHFDSTRYGNNGTTVSVTNQDETGLVDGADEWDGGGDYIIVPDSNSLHLNQKNLTIEVLYNSDGWAHSSYPSLLAKRDAHNTMDWELYYDRANTRLLVTIRESGPTTNFWNANLDPSTGLWHHTVFTRNATTWELFHNGTSMDTGTDNWWTDSEDLAIGALQTDGADDFDGLIDEVRISNITRTNSWINATWYTMRDELISYEAEETSLKGDIPTTKGSIPFWTGDDNPQTCIAMRLGDTCQKSWIVNATGTVGDPYEFFVTYQALNYSSYITDNETSRFDVTIDYDSWLEVNFTFPNNFTAGNPYRVLQFNNFNVNATVICESWPAGYSCGDVSGNVRYNDSATTMTLINATYGAKPFHLLGETSWRNVTTLFLSDQYINTGTADDNYLYVAGNDDLVHVIAKNSTWDNVTKLDPTGVNIWAVANDDNYVYVATANNDRVEIYAKNSTWDNIGYFDPGDAIYSIFVDDNYVYIGGLDDTVYVVAKNSTWDTVATLTPAAENVWGIAADENYIYIGSYDDKLHIVAKNSTWDNVTSLALASNNVRTLTIDENYIYFGSTDNNVYVVAKNSTWDTVTTFTQPGSNVLSVSVDENYVYIGGVDDKVRIFAKNSTWDTITNIEPEGIDFRSVVVDENYIYISGEDNKTHIYKKDWKTTTRNYPIKPNPDPIKPRTEPVPLIPNTEPIDDEGRDKKIMIDKDVGEVYYPRNWNTVDTLTQATDNIRGLAVDENFIYIGDQDNKTHVIAKNSTRDLITSLTPATYWVWNVAVDERYVYIGGYDDKVHVVAKNSTWDNITSLTPATNDVYTVTVDENYVYIGSRDTRVYVVAKNSTWDNVTTITTPTGRVDEIVVDENYVYAGSRDDKTYVFAKNSTWDDITNFALASGNIYGLAVDENYVYVGAALPDNKTYVFAKNSTWDNVVNLTPATDQILELAVDENYVYIGSADNNVHAVAKNSTWDNVTSFSVDATNVLELAVDENYVYIGKGSDDVHIVDKRTPSIPNLISLGTMNDGDQYQLNWTVKATGTKGEVYRIDANFTSLVSYVDDNNTNDAYVMISEATAPQWSNNLTVPPIPVTYSPDVNYQFNVTWTDDIQLDTVLIEHNFTGAAAPHNDSFTGNTGAEYYFNAQDLKAGTYVWRSTANDTSQNANITPSVGYYNYTVEKAKPILKLNNNTVTVNTSGLVGYWRLEGFNSTNGTEDYSGEGNDGLGVNFSTDPATVSGGKLGNAVEFNESERINLDTNLGITGELTFSAWVYPKKAPEGVGRVIASTYDWDADDSLRRGWTIGDPYGSDDTIHFDIYNSSGNQTIISYNNFFAENLNNWVHVAGVYKPSEYLRLYINGVNVSDNTTDVLSSIAYNPSIYLTIGHRSDAPGQGMWNGTIDEVMIFNRSLTAEEIQTLYETRATYLTATTFTGTSQTSGGDSDLSYSLFRNTTNITDTTENGTATTLAAGIHYYLLNTTGGENYTRSSMVLPVKIDKAKPVLKLSNNTYTVNTSGLVGYWRFESINSTNGTEDYSGYGNDGVAYGFGADPVPVSASRFGNAVEYDGDNDYFLVNDDPSLRGMSQITVSAWFYAKSKDNWDKIVGYANLSANSQRKYRLDFDNAADHGMRFVTWDDDDVSNGVATMPVIPVNEWVHVVGVYDGTSAADAVKIYKNGVLNATGAGTGNDVSNVVAGNLTIGVDENAITNDFNGTIDEVMIWNRALTAEEIQTLYETKVKDGASTTFTGSEANTGDSDVTYNFFRNTTDVKATENGTASAIDEYYHYYLFNASGGQNYTRSAIMMPLRLTIDRWLDVNITFPLNLSADDPYMVSQYNNFNVRATVECKSDPAGYSCGNIVGTVRYNDSTTTMTLINDTQGATPFYVVGESKWSNSTSLTPAGNDVWTVAADENYIYIGDADNEVHVVAKNSTWDNITTLTSAAGSVRSIAVDDNYLYIGGNDDKVHVVAKNSTWDTITSLALSSSNVLSVAVDDNYLYIGGDGDNDVYVVAKNSTWDNVVNLTSATDDVKSIVVDQNYVYIGSLDNNVYVVAKNSTWDTVKTLTPAGDYVVSIAVDENYLYISSYDDKVYVIAKNPNWNTVTTLTPANVNLDSVTVDENYLYIGGQNNNVYVVAKNSTWDSVTTLTSAGGNVQSIVVDENYVYIGGNDDKVHVVKKDYQLGAKSFSITSKTHPIKPRAEPVPLRQKIQSIDDEGRDKKVMIDKNLTEVYYERGWYNVTSLTPAIGDVWEVFADENYLYIGGADEDVHVVAKNSTWDNVTTLTPAGGTVKSFAFDENYVYIGASGLDTKVYVVAKNSTWDTVTSLTPTNSDVHAITVDENYVYIGGADKKVHVVAKNSTWDTVTSLTPAGGGVISLDTDDNYLYIGGFDNKVHVVAKNSTWDNVTSLTPAGDRLISVAVDENYVYIGGDDDKVHIVAKNSTWDNVTSLTPAGDDVYAISVDENYVYIGSVDDKVHIVAKNSTWDTVTTLTPAGDDIWSLAVDENYVYIGSHDNKIHVVDKITPADIRYNVIADNLLSLGTMTDGDQYQLNWTINATGTQGETYRIDANFSSSLSAVQDNNTDDAYVMITEATDPQWRNQTTNDTDDIIVQGEAINLTTEGYDGIALDYAILATNETGVWMNKTAYGSPMDMNDLASTWKWSNFTWQNASVATGTVVGWRIYYNDTSGNENMTDIATFQIQLVSISISTELSKGITYSGYEAAELNQEGNVNITLWNNGTWNYNHTAPPRTNETEYWIRNNGNVNQDFCFKANSDLTCGSGACASVTIDINNVGWNNATTNDDENPGYNTTKRLSTSFQKVGYNVGPNSYIYLRFWLFVPVGKPSGYYNATYSVKGVQPGQAC